VGIGSGLVPHTHMIFERKYHVKGFDLRSLVSLLGKLLCGRKSVPECTIGVGCIRPISRDNLQEEDELFKISWPLLPLLTL
jgi:hypothetical protein